MKNKGANYYKTIIIISGRPGVPLMSGTPEPLNNLLLKKVKKQTYFHFADYFDLCNHVEPKKVIVRQESKTEEAARVIKKYHKKNRKVIYFASSITNILQLIKDLNKKGITEGDIGVAFTSNEKKKEFSDYMLSKREMIEERLKTEELLPDDVKIFLTTTKCKEGINIQNDDIKIMFAESSQRAELVQMAGRVRKGLDELNVMCELSRVYKKDILKWERYFSNESLQHVTDKYKDFISKTEKPTKKDVIARIEESFPYIRFDFFRQKFIFFDGKMEGEDLAIKEKYMLINWIDYWYDNKIVKGEIVSPPGNENFKDWFPYSTVRLAEKTPSDEEIIVRVIKKYFEEHDELLEKVISKEERDNILKDINVLLKKEIDDYQDMKQANSLFKKGGYIADEVTKADKKRGRESEYRIIPIPVESSQEDRIKDIPEDVCI